MHDGDSDNDRRGGGGARRQRGETNQQHGGHCDRVYEAEQRRSVGARHAAAQPSREPHGDEAGREAQPAQRAGGQHRGGGRLLRLDPTRRRTPVRALWRRVRVASCESQGI